MAQHQDPTAHLERVAQLQSMMIQAVPFAGLVGLQIAELLPTGAKVLLPAGAKTCNHMQRQHAGALFTLGETASGAAVASALGDMLGQIVPLVRKADIAFLKGTSGTATATATIAREIDGVMNALQSGNRAEVRVEVLIADDSGEDVACMHVDWVIMPRKRP